MDGPESMDDSWLAMIFNDFGGMGGGGMGTSSKSNELAEFSR